MHDFFSQSKLVLNSVSTGCAHPRPPLPTRKRLISAQPHFARSLSLSFSTAWKGTPSWLGSFFLFTPYEGGGLKRCRCYPGSCLGSKPFEQSRSRTGVQWTSNGHHGRNKVGRPAKEVNLAVVTGLIARRRWHETLVLLQMSML